MGTYTYKCDIGNFTIIADTPHSYISAKNMIMNKMESGLYSVDRSDLAALLKTMTNLKYFEHTYSNKRELIELAYRLKKLACQECTDANINAIFHFTAPNDLYIEDVTTFFEILSFNNLLWQVDYNNMSKQPIILRMLYGPIASSIS